GAVDADGEPIDLAIAGGIFVEQAHDAPVLDASGLTAVPGFIDIQMNGGWGHDFTNDPTSIWEVGRVLPRTGVTSFCPTIITSPHDRIEAAQAAMAQRPDGYVGAEPLGLHIEGPHLSEERRGTHPKDLLMPPSGSRLTGDHVAIATIAPELDGAVDLVTTYVMMDIVVSIGHSAATAEQARAAIDAGATLGTHLFNGMPPIGGREPGIAGALLMDQRTRFGVIVDDVHLHDDILAMIWKLAPDRAILITDAIAAAGMPDGRYEIGNIAVEVSEGAVRNDEGNLAGSVLTMDVGLSNIMRRANVALPAAVRALTANPAAALNRPDLGTIAIGNRGDVVLLADDHVVCTVVGGTIAFVQDAESP
ncbi:MAG: N-acetylglucosamine-6-phosphate deacetylase, partial [Acidimicrobiia bacterium]|nr:N-acetylglucosamine-6-phosphate deacetylase [Acidimicrobiia bacterium]